MPKRVNLKPPGSCIFCGRTGSLCKEHFWPDWAGHLITPEGSPNRIEARWKTPATTKAPVLISQKERPGPTAKKKLRIVCKDCNSGWMSCLEEGAKPILERLILGAPFQLGVSAQSLLATWATLKIILGEHNTQGEFVTPAEQRRAFMERLIIPPGMRLWIAQCGGGGWESAYHRQIDSLSFAPIGKHRRPVRPNAQSVTFGIGSLVVHTHHTTVAGVDLNIIPNPKGSLVQLWPNDRPAIEWPLPLSFTPGGVRMLATTFGRLDQAPGVTRIP